MPNNSLIPFFPFKIDENNQAWTTRDPLSDVEYKLGYDGYYLLNLCNGYNTWREITSILSQIFQLSATQVNILSEKVMDDFTKKGLIWWRKRRMQTWQTSPPATVIWDLTYKCNLSCMHCVVNAGNPATDELTQEESKQLIDELSSFGVKNLVLTGGEPLMHPEFFKIAKYAYNRGLDVQVSTNGTLITPKIAKEIAALKAGVQVSLDGLTPEIHNHFRRNKKAWKLTINGIRNLVKEKVTVTLGSVVTKINYSQIPALYKLAYKLQASQFRIMPFVPYGRGRFNKKLEVTPNEMMHLTKELSNLQKSVGLPIAQMQFECLITSPPNIQTSEQTHLGCEGGISYCTITANGDVLPCNFFAGVKTENVREKSFEWIWKNSHFLNYIRSLTISDLDHLCQSCPWLAVCRGSCIAMNFAHGKVFQANSQCWRVASIQKNLTGSKAYYF